jgi:hypothetical protein
MCSGSTTGPVCIPKRVWGAYIRAPQVCTLEGTHVRVRGGPWRDPCVPSRVCGMQTCMLHACAPLMGYTLGSGGDLNGTRARPMRMCTRVGRKRAYPSRARHHGGSHWRPIHAPTEAFAPGLSSGQTRTDGRMRMRMMAARSSVT